MTSFCLRFPIPCIETALRGRQPLRSVSGYMSLAIIMHIISLNVALSAELSGVVFCPPIPYGHTARVFRGGSRW